MNGADMNGRMGVYDNSSIVGMVAEPPGLTFQMLLVASKFGFTVTPQKNAQNP